jgi:uncharacterized protein YciI
MNKRMVWGIVAGLALTAGAVAANNPPAAKPARPPSTVQAPAMGDGSSGYDAQLAASLGADDIGMRHYVMVILKTGTHRVPDGPERDAMFKGHFANIARLAQEGKLAFAGPFDGETGWRGMFLFAVSDIEEAKKLVATDPAVASGEMVAEYHKYYGSAALMLVTVTHARLVKPR